MFSKAIQKAKESHTKPELSKGITLTEFAQQFPREFDDLSKTLATHAAHYRALESTEGFEPYRAHARLDESVCDDLKLRTLKTLSKVAQQTEGLDLNGVQMDFFMRGFGVKIDPLFVKKILAFSKKQ